ncbi:PadR family transcriptional regulator [Streptomyces montanisoli]|uniref:Helix-turn-helix transcriptional regulator n=1 Tax=Streptomyces montanisoli TaxID=2798581 RepID=A0A940RW54_9ACTN|nr:PadR family transcriptional regulator [Streptomyces montanisoli]MBP0458931.1 helix-turn-helix transcriptional regulator [Streptomyces montanisoli]
MAPVFAHGRLRLYLLKLLDEAPRHGYEVIRLLEERFQGLYAPSAGTVYPRLAKLESESLVTHTTEGGRKVYSITDAGRAELASRSGELADLELEIRESVSELAAEIRDDVRGAAGRLRSEMRAATSAPGNGAGPEQDAGEDPWRTAKEEMRRAKQGWKEQARRAKDESRKAREEAQRARRQARETQDFARDEMLRMARQVQDQVQGHFARGDWPTGVREGLSEIVGQLGSLGKGGGWPATPAEPTRAEPTPAEPTPAEPAAPGPEAPSSWAADTPSTGNPERDLERLLDRFRDDVRDASRDHGVTSAQLGEVRRHLSTAAAHITALLTLKGDGTQL